MKITDLIKGKTGVYGILGNPVAHSFSPILQTTLLQEKGRDSIYVPFKVEEDGLKKAVEGAYALNVAGLNVTVPHKTAVMDCLKEIDGTAEKIGAVNTLKRVNGGYKGYNTDIIGLKKTLEMNNVEIKDKTLLVLGAGGAANSAVVLGALEGAKKILIVNRTQAKALILKERVETFYGGEVAVLDYEGLKDLRGADIIIQTTSIGMEEDCSPVAHTAIFKDAQIAVDIVYTPPETTFLKQAKAKGCLTANGFDMLIYQGIAAFEIWNETEISQEEALAFRQMFLNYYMG